MPESLLLIAKNWPEPASTAAGRRTLDLLGLFQKQGYHCVVASSAEPTPFQCNLDALGIEAEQVRMNCQSFDDWVATLNPGIVIYDRFMTEEQFGWRVQQQCPNAFTILDTSDLHCLRTAREQAFKSGEELSLYNAIAQREIPSIVRCDLTLMISTVEAQILQEHFQIAAESLAVLPFIVPANSWQSGETFEARKHCMMIGGFKHEPNRDATRWLAESLWPALKSKLPDDCEMHVYGAYADHAMNQLSNPKERFVIKGRAEDALKTMQGYRLNLGPLRFGAGQKGKILEGWLSGTPTISNNLGFESMIQTNTWPFGVAENLDDWSSLCAQLYTDKNTWQACQNFGFRQLQSEFLVEKFDAPLFKQIDEIRSNLSEHRANNFWRGVLQNQQYRAQEFMGRWIELKERFKDQL